MLDKIYNFTNKHNYLTLFTLFLIFTNFITILTFKTTAWKTTYFCRVLVLISAIIMLVAVTVELFNCIYRFIKEKKGWQFGVEITLLILTLTLSIYVIIKYTSDFAVYYVHNNQTNLLMLGVCFIMCAYETFRNFDKLKQNWANYIFLPAVFLVSLVLALVNIKTSNVMFCYIYAMAIDICMFMWLLGFKSYFVRDIFVCISAVCTSIIALVSFSASLGSTDMRVFDPIYLISIIGMLLPIVNFGAILLSRKSVLQIVIRAIIVAISIFVFVKMLHFDTSLKSFDLSRIFMFVTVAVIFLAILCNLKNWLSISYFSAISGFGTLFTILAIAFYCLSKRYETSLYTSIIVGFGILLALLLAYVITNYVLNRKQ